MIGSICLCDVDWNQVDGEFYVGGLQEVDDQEEDGDWEEDRLKIEFEERINIWGKYSMGLYSFNANHDLMTYLMFMH